MKIGACIRALFDDYKFARRFALFWAMGLMTYMAFKFFGMAKVEAAHATVLVSFIGILATVIGFYQWHRSRDE